MDKDPKDPEEDIEEEEENLITLDVIPSEDDLAALEKAAAKSKRTSVKLKEFLTNSKDIPPSPMRQRKDPDTVVNLTDISVSHYTSNTDEPDVQMSDLQKQIKKAKEQEEIERIEALRSKAREDVNDSDLVRTLDRLFCFKLPMMNLPLGPILFFFFICTLLGVLLYYTARDFTWGGPKLYNWFWWGDFVLVTYILIHMFWKLILLFVKRVFFFSKFFYYINGLAGMATLLVWSIVQKAAWRAIVKIDSSVVIDQEVSYYIENFLTLFIYVSILRGVKLVFVKAIIAYSQRNTFWKTLTGLLFNERVIRVLSKNPRKKNIDQHLNASITPLNVGFTLEDEPAISAVEFRKAWRKVFKREAKNKKLAREAVSLTDVAEYTKNIFANVDATNKGYFTPEDLRPFFRSKESIDVVFELFDKDRDGKVGFDEASMFVRDVYQSRKALYATLHDREDIASILTNSLGVVFWFLMFLLGLSVFGVNTTSLLIPLGSAFVTLGVVFGATFRDFWENFIFIWQVRPFDVGDKVVIDTFPTLTIHRIHLMYTEAYAGDGRQFLIPNNLLKTKVITQYKRSRNYSVFLQTHFSANTPKEKIEKLQKRIRKFLREDPAPWDHDEAMMYVSDMTNTNRITLDIGVDLKGVTWQVSRLYLIPKSRLWLTIQQICLDLNITYEVPAAMQPIKPPEKSE